MFYDYEPPEIPQYLLEIDEIISKEVQRQVEASNADIQALRNKETEWLDKLRKLQEELRQERLISMKAIAEKNQAEEALQNEMKNRRILSAKELFDGWDKAPDAFYIRDYETSIKCPVCQDKRKISIEHQGAKLTSECPVCAGNWGRSICAFTGYEVKSIWTNGHLIGEVYLASEKTAGVQPCYRSYYRNDVIQLRHAFKTKAEAESVAQTKHQKAKDECIAKVYKYIDEKQLVHFLPEDDPHRKKLENGSQTD